MVLWLLTSVGAKDFSLDTQHGNENNRQAKSDKSTEEEFNWNVLRYRLASHQAGH
jgi:hypothetical protein